jgi:hypothetical protein
MLRVLVARTQKLDSMMSTANDPTAVFAAALNLPLEKRKELAQELILSVDRDEPKDPDYDRLWADEIQRRWERYQRGEVELIDHEAVMKRLQDAVVRGRQC